MFIFLSSYWKIIRLSFRGQVENPTKAIFFFDALHFLLQEILIKNSINA